MESREQYLGRIAYEAYCETTGWKSAVTGADLPAFYDTPAAVQTGWIAAANAVSHEVSDNGQIMPKLALAVRNLKEKIDEIIDGDIEPGQEDTGDLRDAKDLLGVLAHIVEGKSVVQAFGSPGDWGYGTPIGAALASR